MEYLICDFLLLILLTIFILHLYTYIIRSKLDYILYFNSFLISLSLLGKFMWQYFCLIWFTLVNLCVIIKWVKWIINASLTYSLSDSKKNKYFKESREKRKAFKGKKKEKKKEERKQLNSIPIWIIIQSNEFLFKFTQHHNNIDHVINSKWQIDCECKSQNIVNTINFK